MNKISYTIIFLFSSMVIFSQNINNLDTVCIKNELYMLCKAKPYRNGKDLVGLNFAADYIKKVFSAYSDSVSEQIFSIDTTKYRNVICSFGTENKERIIVGAHYDVRDLKEGADDDASGVVGLIELAKLLKSQKLNYRIDLVAYTLEERPYFKTDSMGSFHHAKFLYDNHIPVKGVICMDMIGYFSDEKNSQHFPLKFLKLFYSSTGNYITIVQKFGNGSFGRQFKRNMKKSELIPVSQIKGFSSMAFLRVSDNLCYWRFGFPALLITDTAGNRNHNYHQSTDTIETLDLKRMSLVILSVFYAIMNFK